MLKSIARSAASCRIHQPQPSLSLMVRGFLNSRPSHDVITSRTSSSTGNKAPTAGGPNKLDSINARGLFNPDVMKHLKPAPVKELQLKSNGKVLEIQWADGHTSQFHASWLRHNCHCPTCRLDYNGMITINFDDLDLDHLRIIDSSLEGDEVLAVRWQDTPGGQPHEGSLLVRWLRQQCYSKEADSQRRKQRAMTFYSDKTTPEISYSEVTSSESGVYRWLCYLSERGLCLVKGVPQQTGQVQKIAELIAPIQHTVYGETFDVVSTPHPVNAAYSPVKLDLHMDQVHYESPPGIQFLHCVQFDPEIVGGDNTFADIHEIAARLNTERPDYYRILARVPVTFQTIHYSRVYPVHLQIQRPILSLNHLNELVSVFWHPLLVGPLQVNSDDVEPFYKAYQYFFTLINSYQSIYRLRMVAGDMITFNNRRVLHGRGSYSNQKGTRHLQGTYVEISEFQSRLQVLHNKVGDGRLAVRSGSLDWQ